MTVYTNCVSSIVVNMCYEISVLLPYCLEHLLTNYTLCVHDLDFVYSLSFLLYTSHVVSLPLH